MTTKFLWVNNDFKLNPNIVEFVVNKLEFPNMMAV